MKPSRFIAPLSCALLAACGGGGNGGTTTAPAPGANEQAPSTRTIALLAGETGGYGNLDGNGEIARLSAPAGLSADADGNLYIADRQNRSIRKMTPQGQVSTVATGFIDPASVVADRAGNLYVWDVGNATIRKISPSGAVSTFATIPGPGRATFLQVAQLAIDNSGTLYAADPGNQAIVSVSTSGQVTTLVRSSSAPGGIAVDQSGNLYFSERFTVRRMSAAGLITTLAGMQDDPGYADGAGKDARFGTISAIAVNGSGELLVTDQDASRVRKVTADGTVSTIAGRGLASVSHPERDLVAPGGLVLTSKGKIYVSDTGNNVIREARPDGSVATVAGMALSGWSYDTEPGRQFYLLSGVAVDKAGNSYLADVLGSIYKAGAQGPMSKVETNGFIGYIEHIVAQDDGSLHTANADGVYRIGVDGKAIQLNPYPRPAGEVAIVRLSGLAADGKGGVYAASMNGIHHLAADGAIAQPFTTTVKPEGGLAVDASGNFYVSGDCANGPLDGSGPHAQPSRIDCSIFKLNASGSVTKLLDGASSTVKLRQPVRLALDPASGNLYVADRIAGYGVMRPDRGPQVFKITPQGQVSPVLGSAGLRGFKQDSPQGSLPDFVTGMTVQGNSLYLTTPAAALKVTGLP